jgi:hypothetical protein
MSQLPRAKAVAVRFVGTLRGECLDQVLIPGEGHLRKVLAEYVRAYNGHRSHLGQQQQPRCTSPTASLISPPGSSKAESSGA